MPRFLIALFLVLSPISSDADESFTNADLLRNFDVIAFGNEYTGQKYDHVRKWAKPMLMGIQGKDYPAHLETFIDDVAKDLSETTGHRIELYYSFAKHKAGELAADFDRNKVNVILYYMDDEDLPGALAKYWNCLLYTSPSPRDGLLSRMPSSA